MTMKCPHQTKQFGDAAPIGEQGRRKRTWTKEKEKRKRKQKKKSKITEKRKARKYQEEDRSAKPNNWVRLTKYYYFLQNEPHIYWWWRDCPIMKQAIRKREELEHLIHNLKSSKNGYNILVAKWQKWRKQKQAEKKNTLDISMVHKND